MHTLGFTSRPKKILSNRWITVAVILFAVCARIIQLIFFYNIRVDASYQVMATQNFVNGHGISTAQVLPANISQIIYEPLINWPPGYSFLLSPFYILTGHNYIAAGITLDIICALLLVFISRAILKLFDAPLYLRNVFTLLTSLFIYSFYFIACSDAIAISFFVAALYLCMAIIKKEKASGFQIAGLALCLIIAAFTKYLFIPVVFVIPVFLFIKGFADKKNILKKAGLFSFLLLLCSVVVLLVYQKTVSGTAGYISEPQRGFYTEHLLDFYPFLPASFLKPDSWDVVLQKSNRGIFVAYKILHLLALATGIFAFAFLFLRKKFKDLTLKNSFVYTAFFISIGIVLLLTALSLRVDKEEIMPGTLWTYIEETRYYGLIYVFVHLSLFIFFQSARQKKWMKFLFLILLLGLSIEAMRGLVLTAKRIMLFNKEEYSWQYEDRFQQYANSVIEKAKQQSGVNTVAVAGSSYYMNHRVSLYSHVPILYKNGSLNEPGAVASKSPAVVLVIIQEKAFELFAPFLSQKDKELAGRFDDFYFYTLYVEPR